MVGWWPGDGTPNDIVGTNPGTLQGGATFGAGMVAQAFALDGVNSYVDVANAPALQVSASDFSVDAWVRFASLTAPPGSQSTAPGDMSIVDKMSSSGLNTNGWRLLKQADNRFWFCLGGGATNGCSAAALTTVRSTTMATPGVWYHVAAVKTGSSLSVYVNGVLEATTALGTFADAQMANLRIGSYAAEGSYLNGQVDEVELFNRALSGAEIQALYNAGSGGKLKAP
jgi:hypothetical protein